jgi:2-polyprenyl-3-methyl-5-hydroxy-6-metoxy-1,4-benzoquinol methylase
MKFKVVTNAKFGYKQLSPIPSPTVLDKFYKETYYETPKPPQLKRFMKGGKAAQREIDWYAKTLWTDIKDTLSKIIPSKKKQSILDIGAGTGYFAKFMKKAGWDAVAIEPSIAASKKAKKAGVDIYPSIKAFQNEKGSKLFDVVTLLNVLEHVPGPEKFLKEILKNLKRKGILVVQVPNDFSPIQMLIQKKLKKKSWWVSIPDHCNYFNSESLGRLLKALKLDVVETLSDFPMEFFLLFGDDYLKKSNVGAECHQRRVNFDMMLPAPFRREILKSLNQHDIGRNVMLFARKK